MLKMKNEMLQTIVISTVISKREQQMQSGEITRVLRVSEPTTVEVLGSDPQRRPSNVCLQLQLCFMNKDTRTQTGGQSTVNVYTPVRKYCTFTDHFNETDQLIPLKIRMDKIAVCASPSLERCVVQFACHCPIPHFSILLKDLWNISE